MMFAPFGVKGGFFCQGCNQKEANCLGFFSPQEDVFKKMTGKP